MPDLVEEEPNGCIPLVHGQLHEAEQAPADRL